MLATAGAAVGSLLVGLMQQFMIKYGQIGINLLFLDEPFKATPPLVALRFIVALLNGQSLGSVPANETDTALFLQGLMIEMFILAIYAISYDLILGITGLLPFGHAMFFAAGAYGTGIMFKNLGGAWCPRSLASLCWACSRRCYLAWSWPA